MIAGFFIGLALWSVVNVAITVTAKWYEYASTSGVIGSFLLLAGNGAGIGYFSSRLLQ